MLSLVRRAGRTGHVPPALRRCRYSTKTTSTTYEPLNILFCGSDDFSIYSLRALQQLRQNRPDKINSIEVLCRPDKPGGRGLKQIHQVPIKPVATELGLPLHQVDTFKGWTLPPFINLIVAVSFGLLVPARILEAAKYGGVNVHPSLLPDLRGPAPIVHALLKRRTHTGVSVQTMHPTKFDHGSILAQTPSPGIAVPESATPELLNKTLGPLEAGMLSQVIEEGLFVDAVNGDHSTPTRHHLDHAPKLTAEDQRIDWTTWTAEEILLRDRVLGRLWDAETYAQCVPGSSKKRIVFQGPWTITSLADNDRQSTSTPGRCVIVGEGHETRLGIWTCDGRVVLPFAATIDGAKKGSALNTLISRLILATDRHSR